MIRTFVVGGLLLILFGTSLAQSSILEQSLYAQPATHQVAPTEQKGQPVPGRYQGAVDRDTLWLFDTATGECWKARPGGQWKRVIAPVKEAEQVPAALEWQVR